VDGNRNAIPDFVALGMIYISEQTLRHSKGIQRGTDDQSEMVAERIRKEICEISTRNRSIALRHKHAKHVMNFTKVRFSGPSGNSPPEAEARSIHSGFEI
jgi:hypothetical protein